MPQALRPTALYGPPSPERSKLLETYTGFLYSHVPSERWDDQDKADLREQIDAVLKAPR
jgi:hypothetical protein